MRVLVSSRSGVVSVGRWGWGRTITLSLLAAVLSVGTVVVPGTRTASAAEVLTARPLKVVLLGDSYAAGNGAGSIWDYWGPENCYRSSRNWAELYLDALRNSYNVTFVNRACSGGVLNDLTERRYKDLDAAAWPVTVDLPGLVDIYDPVTRQQLESMDVCPTWYDGDEGYDAVPASASYNPLLYSTTVSFSCTRYMEPQWNAVDTDTDLVLLSIGGNDVNFADIIKQCFAPFDRNVVQCRQQVVAAQDKVDSLSDDIEGFLHRLKDRMRPDATIVLNAYPYLERNPDYVLSSPVNLFGLGDSYDVGRQVRELGDLGDEAQRRAVRAVNADPEPGPQVIFLDAIKSHFAGHEPDGRVLHENPDSWIHEITGPILMESYHYNPTGHSEIANLLSYVGVVDPGEGGGGEPETTLIGKRHTASTSGTGRTMRLSSNDSPDQPYAWADGPYVATVGETVTLDGRGSYGRTANLTQWEWDINNDGVYDYTSGTPVITHTYSSDFDGLIRLRVTDSAGNTAVAHTVGHASVDGDERPAGRDNCPQAANPGQEDYDHDGVGDVCDPTPGWPATNPYGTYDNGGIADPDGDSTPGSVTTFRRPPLRIGSTIASTADTADYVGIRHGGGKLRISLTGSPRLPADYDLVLTDTTGRVLYRSVHTGKHHEHLRASLPAGNYLIGVLPKTGQYHATKKYWLRVTAPGKGKK